MATAQTTDELCAGCLRDNEEVTAHLWCNNCAEPVCPNCGKAHRRFITPHNVIDIQDVSKVSRSVPKTCVSHPEQKLILFCVEHDKIICTLCLSQNHKECKDVIDIERAAVGIKENASISNLKERIRKLQDTVEYVKGQNETRLSEVNDEKQKAVGNIRNIRECLDGHLARIENQLSLEYDTIVHQITDDSKQVDEMGQTLQNRLDEIDKVVEKNSECHLFHIIKHLESIQLVEERKTIEIGVRTHLELDIFPNDFIKNIDCTFEKLQYRKANDSVVDSNTGQDYRASQVPISAERKLGYTSSILSDRNARFGACCFTEDNRLVVIEFPQNSKSTLKVYDEQELCETIRLSFEALAICMYDKSIALVTNRRKSTIAVVNISSLEEGRHITPIWNDADFNPIKCEVISYCNGLIWTLIALKEEKQNKYISRIYSLDCHGTILKTIFATGDVYDMCINGDTLYVTDEIRNDITSICINGETNTALYNGIELRAGCKIAYCEGNIFLLEYETNTVYKLNKKNKFLSVVLKDKFWRSNHLCLNSKTKQLVITSEGGRSLEIFNI